MKIKYVFVPIATISLFYIIIYITYGYRNVNFNSIWITTSGDIYTTESLGNIVFKVNPNCMSVKNIYSFEKRKYVQNFGFGFTGNNIWGSGENIYVAGYVEGNLKIVKIDKNENYEESDLYINDKIIKEEEILSYTVDVIFSTEGDKPNTIWFSSL